MFIGYFVYNFLPFQPPSSKNASALYSSTHSIRFSIPLYHPRRYFRLQRLPHWTSLHLQHPTPRLRTSSYQTLIMSLIQFLGDCHSDGSTLTQLKSSVL